MFVYNANAPRFGKQLQGMLDLLNSSLTLSQVTQVQSMSLLKRDTPSPRMTWYIEPSLLDGPYQYNDGFF